VAPLSLLLRDATQVSVDGDAKYHSIFGSLHQTRSAHGKRLLSQAGCQALLFIGERCVPDPCQSPAGDGGEHAHDDQGAGHQPDADPGEPVSAGTVFVRLGAHRKSSRCLCGVSASEQLAVRCPLVCAEHRGDVVSADAKGIGDREAVVGAAWTAGDDVEIDLGVQIPQVEGRRHDTIA
jgi:hypothetical protein